MKKEKINYKKEQGSMAMFSNEIILKRDRIKKKIRKAKNSLRKNGHLLSYRKNILPILINLENELNSFKNEKYAG